MFNHSFKIADTTISSSHKPYIVAEIGLNHNNDPETGKKTIQAAARAGAHAVKFQSYITEEFIDRDNAEAKVLFDIFKQYELSEKSHLELQRTAAEEGVTFFSTPLDVSSLNLLVGMKVPVIKIASGDIVNSELLLHTAKTGLPVILSTGASSQAEIKRALEFLNENQVKELCLMHCVSLYPASPEDLNLVNIRYLKEMTDGPVGFSDHSAGKEGAMIATGLGARIIEKHFTLDKTLPGPDHTISADPEELTALVEAVSLAYKMSGEQRLEPLAMEKKGHFFGRRSLYCHTNGKIMAMRPDMNVMNPQVAPAWHYIDLKKTTCPPGDKNSTVLL